MDRKFVVLDLPEGVKRYRLIYNDNVICDPMSALARQRQDHMLAEFNNNYDLRRCGPIHFRTMKMHHDGNVWLIELEAEEDTRAY